MQSGIQPFPTIPSIFLLYNYIYVKIHICIIYMLFLLLLFLTGGNKKRVQTSSMDANPIRKAPECCDMGGLAHAYHGTLSWETYLPI
jgi:hypothetical protein